MEGIFKKPLFNDKGSHNIGLLLKVDWFKPFDRSEYKVSALMMSGINLPRSERYLKKRAMVLGIIPGRTEPKLILSLILSLKISYYYGMECTWNHVGKSQSCFTWCYI